MPPVSLAIGNSAPVDGSNIGIGFGTIGAILAIVGTAFFVARRRRSNPKESGFFSIINPRTGEHEVVVSQSELKSAVELNSGKRLWDRGMIVSSEPGYGVEEKAEDI
jgi:hypothetical protein